MKNFLVGLMVIPVFLVVCLCTGCSRHELTKEEAKTFLSKQKGAVSRPVHKRLLVKTVNGRGQEELSNQMERQAVEKLRDAGYFTVGERTKEAGGRKEMFYEIAATSKLAPFVIREDAEVITVKFGDIVVDEVTGIVRKGDEADVAFTRKMVPTSLGEIFPVGGENSKNINHATFRFQDGTWR